MRKLNIRCGRDIRDGWVNLDCIALPGVDVVHDITQLSLPFEDNIFDLIHCKDILEHLEYIPVLRDIHRILKSSGELHIRVPHFTSKDTYGDPTYRRAFTVQTFRYFTQDHFREYYFDFHFSRLAKVTLRFDKRLAYFYNFLIEPLVNLGMSTQNVYEGTPLRVFPATNMDIILVK